MILERRNSDLMLAAASAPGLARGVRMGAGEHRPPKAFVHLGFGRSPVWHSQKLYITNRWMQKQVVNTLLREIRDTPLLWMLVFVPIVLVAEAVAPHSHTLLFVLAVLAIVPLAALLSHATEAVAARTGDAVGGLLNATLGNLTELIIAITALRAGEYMLVKASIAGAIVTNATFMLGACLLLGGLRYHVQEYNRAGARLSSGLLLMATVALLAPSAVADLELRRRTEASFTSLASAFQSC